MLLGLLSSPAVCHAVTELAAVTDVVRTYQGTQEFSSIMFPVINLIVKHTVYLTFSSRFETSHMFDQTSFKRPGRKPEPPL